MPSRCVTRAFRARVSVSASRGVGRARAYLDRRSLRRSTRKRFSVRVDATRLRRGRHRLTVMASDRLGKRARGTVKFVRC